MLARLEQAVAYFGGLHDAVNCEGIVLTQRVLGKKRVHDLASFTKVVQVNLIGT